MARLRKATRTFRDPAVKAAALAVTVSQDVPVFSIEPGQIFKNAAPLEVEIGAGKGDFIIERAASMPDRNFLAVELAGSVSRMLAARAGRCELLNLRVLRADARSLVNLLLPDRSVSAYHIYFPDPWPKKRHVKHRLFTADFANGLRRTLCAGGRISVATDVADYATEIFAVLKAGGFERLEEPVPGAHRTGFGQRFFQLDRPVLAASFSLR